MCQQSNDAEVERERGKLINMLDRQIGDKRLTCYAGYRLYNSVEGGEEWRRVIFSWFFFPQATRVAVCPNMATCKCQFSLHLQAKSFVLAAGRKFPSSFCCRQRKLSAARSEHKQLQLVLLLLMVQLQLQLVSPDFADTCYAGPSSMCNINKG